MAEESFQEKPVKVRDLITAFERKTTDFSRPRAHSMGDVLSKNVLVRYQSLSNLDKIETALQQFQSKLNQYEVYKKELHVALQEEIFNILANIVSIKSATGDGEEIRYLISSTQKLLSHLSRKLPSSNSAITEQRKYVPYDVYSRSKEKSDETGGTEGGATTPKFREESWGFKDGTRHEKLYRSDLSLSLTKPDVVNTSIGRVTPPKQSPSDKNPAVTSVSQLRSLFESKERDNMEGLGVILKNDTPKFKFRVNIPYNARRQPIRTFQNSLGLRKFLANSAPKAEPDDDDDDNVDADEEDEVFFQEPSVVPVDEVNSESWGRVEIREVIHNEESSIERSLEIVQSDQISEVSNRDSGSESGTKESDSDSSESVESVKAVDITQLTEHFDNLTG